MEQFYYMTLWYWEIKRCFVQLDRLAISDGFSCPKKDITTKFGPYGRSYKTVQVSTVVQIHSNECYIHMKFYYLHIFFV